MSVPMTPTARTTRNVAPVDVDSPAKHQVQYLFFYYGDCDTYNFTVQQTCSMSCSQLCH